MVGNTVVDALKQNLSIAYTKKQIFNSLNLEYQKFILVTVHRQENVDSKDRFASLIKGLQLVQQTIGIPLVYPIHPRAKKQLCLFGIDTSGLTLIEPLDYLSFLELEGKAKLVLTDSGGVQEETCILGVPCVTLRDNTERPETIDVGANVLAGVNPKTILESANKMISSSKAWANPFGEGDTAQKIIKILQNA